MKLCRIMFLHPAIRSEDDVRRLLRFDEREYGLLFELDNYSPEYVIGSEMIYSNTHYRKMFCDQLKKNSIKVFYAGECVCADLNIFDYAIVFDKHLEYDDRVGRMPTVLYFLGSVNPPFRKINIQGRPEKREFCSFIYSNPYAHPYRDELFYIINRYRMVHSFGRHLNNATIRKEDRHDNWREESIRIKSRYKFSISAENAKYSGYTTEKIIHTFQAGSVPIYWGNPLVVEEFNIRSFIYIDENESECDIIDKVQKINENDELYMRMLNEPWMTNEQLSRAESDARKYYSFLDNLFKQRFVNAKRAGSGTWSELYHNWFSNIECR